SAESLFGFVRVPHERCRRLQNPPGFWGLRQTVARFSSPSQVGRVRKARQRSPFTGELAMASQSWLSRLLGLFTSTGSDRPQPRRRPALRPRVPLQLEQLGERVVPANHLMFGVQPTNTTAGVAISPAVTVRVVDEFNQLVFTDNST